MSAAWKISGSSVDQTSLAYFDTSISLVVLVVRCFGVGLSFKRKRPLGV
jgi:hypothetical protein